MIECAKCGTENMFDGAAFCRSCGAELMQAKAVATATKKHRKDKASDEEDQRFKTDSFESDPELEVRESYEEPEPNDNLVQDQEPSEAPRDRAESVQLDEDGLPSSAENVHDQPTDSNPPGDKNATDFDRALKKYNEPTDESLEIESAADVLMRTQTDEDKTGDRMKHSSNDRKSEARQTNEIASASADEAVSLTDKKQLLDNLSKTLQPEQPLTEPPVTPAIPKTEVSHDDELNNEQSEMGWGVPSDAEPVTDSPAHDILHVRGNKVLLAMTPPPRPGESIKFRGKKYTLTKGPIDKKTVGLGAALLFLLIVIIIVQQLTAPVPPQPSLFGVVKNSETNEVLAGVNVTIPQLDIFTVTDEYGSFRFAGLQNNTYQVRLEGELYEAKFYPVSIADNNSSFLQANLDPILPDKNRSRSNASNTDEARESKPRVGELKIDCNVENASVIVNGKDLGTTERTFSRMKIGEHDLLIRHEGYQDFTQPIKITPGETTVVTVNLLENEPEAPVVVTAADHFAKAEELMNSHKFTEAAGHYTLALAKDKDYVQAYLRRAEANVAQGKDLAARADYRAAADYYLNSSRYRNAITCFDKILALAPNSVGALQSRGWCKIWNGDKEGGLFDLNRALSIVPEDVDARFQVGKALYVIGNYKEAEKSLKKLKDDADKSPEIYAYLALTHLARGDEKDARKTYEKFQQYANSTLQARMSSETEWQKLLAIQEN